MGGMEDFLNSAGSAVQTEPRPTATAVTAPAKGSMEAFLNEGQETDPLTGAPVPIPVAGHTPETALNRSIVSAQDRLALSFGTTSGNIEYLKRRFDGVSPILDNNGQPTKNLAVLKDKKWYRVDPENGEVPTDGWERTREYLKDAVDFAPEAIGLGTAMAANALIAAPAAGLIAMSGGAAAPGVIGGIVAADAAITGAVSAGLRTSLGRIIGTYDASPEEQAWDMGFESLLNLGGVKVAAGVKPTAKWTAGKLDAMKEAFKDTMPKTAEVLGELGGKAVRAGEVAVSPAIGAKNMLKKMLTSGTVGENNFDIMMENTARQKAMMNRLYEISKGKQFEKVVYHDEGTKIQVKDIKDTADTIREDLSSIYDTMRNKILAQTPKNYSVNLEDPVRESYNKALSNGIGKLLVNEGDKQLELTGAAAVERLAQKGFKNAEFQLFSQAELANRIKRGASLDKGVGALSVDKEAHQLLSEYYKDLGQFVGGESRTGINGAKDLLDFKKVATDMSYKLAGTSAVQSAPAVKMLVDESRTAIDNSIMNSFSPHKLDTQFVDLNETYSNLSKGFYPFLDARKRYMSSGDPKIYEGLLNNFLSRPGKNPGARSAIDDAIAAADEHGLKEIADRLRDKKLNIQIVESAKAFNPINPGEVKRQNLSYAKALAYGAAAWSHDPKAIAIAAFLEATSNPKTAQAAVYGLSQGQAMLSKMSPREIGNFLSNPDAMNKFSQAIIQAPFIREQAEQQVNNYVMQQIQPQASQRPPGQ